MRRLIAILTLLCLPSIAADQAQISAMKQPVAALKEQIRILEKQLSELESGAPTASTSPASAQRPAVSSSTTTSQADTYSGVPSHHQEGLSAFEIGQGGQQVLLAARRIV